MKDGLVFENNELLFYKDGQPYHAGVIEVDGDIYYISSKGRAVTGRHIVHRDMANGILERGTYTFGEDYKLVEGSYIAPKEHRKKRSKRSSRNIVREKIKVFFRKKQNRAAALAVGFLVLFLAFLPMLVEWSYDLVSAEHENTETQNASDVRIILPDFEEDVLLCSEAAKMEFDGEIDLEMAVETGDPYRPFYFEYHLRNTSGILLLSETEDMTDAMEFALFEGTNRATIDNLKVDTTYYYEVQAADQVHTGTFHTAKSNRFVYIPGLVNTRDIGGYVTLDGKKVKQGLLIRGVELDGLVNAPYYIPNEEIANVRDTFGFVYDFDLREPSVYNGAYSSRLGVDHKFYNGRMYGAAFTNEARKIMGEIFRDLADPEKYPMYLHCTWGTDRTGTVIFLLQGILGISEEDMKREYLLTSYTNKRLVDSTNPDVIIHCLEPYDGDTLQEKIVTFLTTKVGVTQAEINSIRSIFLED